MHQNDNQITKLKQRLLGPVFLFNFSCLMGQGWGRRICSPDKIPIDAVNLGPILLKPSFMMQRLPTPAISSFAPTLHLLSQSNLLMPCFLKHLLVSARNSSPAFPTSPITALDNLLNQKTQVVQDASLNTHGSHT